MKRCSKCKIKKETSAFYSDKSRKDNLFPYCKSCYGTYRKPYNKLHDINGKHKIWRMKNRERLRKYSIQRQKKYREEHPLKDYAKSQKDYLQRMRLSVLEALGGECIRCGFDDKRALQIDHIKGENKYQLLCANCNWIKRVENNERNKNEL
jgi:hypothetical protein